MQNLIDKENPLVEVIARAIFEERHHYHHKTWDYAKMHDQWLAKSSWDTALAVFRALPLAIAVPA